MEMVIAVHQGCKQLPLPNIKVWKHGKSSALFAR